MKKSYFISFILCVFMCACSSPRQTGEKEAVRDFNSGIMQLEVYGLRMKSSPYEKYLAKHGVTMKTVAGCVVNDEITGHAAGYNAKMKELVKQKLGKDIFKEALAASKKR